MGYSLPRSRKQQYMASATLPEQATAAHFTVLGTMENPHDRRQRSRTKIIATVGPACSEPSQLAELLRAGVDVFRLNMAHADADEQQRHVDNIRALSEQVGEPIAILVDLAGPKIRLGNLPNDRLFCERDAEFWFVCGRQPQAENELTATYGPLVKELRVGDRVMLADGTVPL